MTCARCETFLFFFVIGILSYGAGGGLYESFGIRRDVCIWSCLGIVYAYVLQIRSERRIVGRRGKEKRLRVASSASQGGRKAFERIIGYVPPWVDESATESAEWLNRAIEKLWPALIPQMDKVLCAALNPILETNLPPGFVALYFDSVRLGLLPPRVRDFRIGKGSGNVSAAFEFRLSLAVARKDDASVRLTAKSLILALPVVLDNITVDGTLRMELRDMGGTIPCFRAIAISFLAAPRIDFDILPGRDFDLAHLPIIHEAISSVLEGQLRNTVVSPNVLHLPLDDLMPGVFD